MPGGISRAAFCYSQAMHTYKTVAEFLADQNEEKRAQVNALREIILDSAPSLSENIKWNAPNYVFNKEDRITFNVMNKEGAVKLILHMGASKKEDKKATPVLNDESKLIAWNSNIRGTLTFTNLADIKNNQEQLGNIVKRWLALT